jgi:ribosomal protein S18 acetylase RimI-like enzyme
VTSVRHALAADLPSLEATLVAAFQDDPMMTWMFPDAAARPAQSGGFWRVALHAGLRRGHTYATDRDEAVAVWSPPDVPMFDDADLEALGTHVGEQIGGRAELVFEGLGALTAHHPEEPHFYLLGLGTRPEAQGRGLGGTVVADVLRRCDAQALPAYLESSNIRNVPFYERLGFEVVVEVELPEGPVMRPMWRAPRLG